MSSPEDAWELALIRLASQLPHSTFEQWIRPLNVAGVTKQNQLVLQGPINVTPWTRRRYGDLIEAAIIETSSYEGVFRG